MKIIQYFVIMRWSPYHFPLHPTMVKPASLIILGITLGALLYSFIQFNGDNNYYDMILSGGLGGLISYLIYEVGLLLNKKVSWIKRPGTRMLSGILIEFIISISIISLAIFIHDQYWEDTEIRDNDNIIKIAIILFSVHLIYNVIYYAVTSYNFYADGQLKEVRFNRKQTQLQLDTLKAQLSPHFLFNSINILSSLFLKDKNKAESFIRSLANSYSYTLRKIHEPLVSVESELAFVDDYCNMIRTRFGNHLNIEQRLHDSILESKLPPLTLQMLVENAVKHNVMGTDHVLNIKIINDDLHIIVSNNITKPVLNKASLKIGLKNIADRYQLISQEEIVVSSGSTFTVRLPIIK